ncbi:MAG: imidazolonepropionase [Ignavibacteriaceae bacterium]|nr:imidazolonepropionase [Ignavibacteriaceae bacterium]
MITLLKNPFQIVSVDTKGKNSKRGSELSEIGLILDHSIIVEDDLIKDLVPNSAINKYSFDKEIDLNNKTVLPGFVECHTHSVFSGSRANEFRLKLKGVSYEEIARAGGGINTTVKAVREAEFEELVKLLSLRIEYFIAQGITTLEIKSGYGLDFENEIKLLQVIRFCSELYPIKIIPTFLGAHTFPSEFKENHEGYIRLIRNEMLPYIAKNKLAEFCDCFCESSAFSSEETDKIFSTAKEFGIKLKLHTDQFNSIGGIDIALKHNAVSVDHLEVIPESYIEKLAGSETVCDLLPGVSFFLNHNFAPARKLIDAGALVALSTDYNPGSSNISGLNLIMSIAALKMKMTIEETISAVTINAAKSVCLEKEIGSIEPGKKADFAVLDTKEYSDLIYNVGMNLNCMTIKNGVVIYNRN